MNGPLYRYRFAEEVDLVQAEGTLLLATLAAQGLYGEARVRMDMAYAADRTIGVIVVDAGTDVGDAVNAIFTAFLAMEFGRGAFSVRAVAPLRGGQVGQGNGQ